ncbi:hypothetical protein PIB30_055283 [Stylosanthes scabra]|uniref:Uncharacterized protein n=1 Tax=Stylosanthes scabra TaxID=79078 RepID=A0ABU6UJW8_9FABA|nr:hypothetical protein [Stylosanthes scabra]
MTLKSFQINLPADFKIPRRVPPSLSAPSQTELIAVAPTASPSHRCHLLSCAAPEVTFVASHSLSRLTSSHSQKHRRAISRSVVWSPSLSSPRLPTQGIHPSIRGEVWEFQLGCYDPKSTFDEREQLRQLASKCIQLGLSLKG